MGLVVRIRSVDPFLMPFPRYTGSHPDKLKLAENQTKEEADAHFVDLTKAYKAWVALAPGA